MNTPTEKEINKLIGDLDESLASGKSKYPGMTYEQGIRDAIDWIQGNGDRPLE